MHPPHSNPRLEKKHIGNPESTSDDKTNKKCLMTSCDIESVEVSLNFIQRFERSCGSELWINKQTNGRTTSVVNLDMIVTRKNSKAPISLYSYQTSRQSFLISNTKGCSPMPNERSSCFRSFQIVEQRIYYNSNKHVNF